MTSIGGLSASALVAVILALVFGVIAILHVYWAARGVSPGSAALPTRASGSPVFLPTRFSTLLVACALFAAAGVVLGRAGLIAPARIPPFVFRTGTWVLAAVFLLRTIGDFRYVGVFKRQHDTAFARADSKYFTPLCVVIAVCVMFVAIA